MIDEPARPDPPSDATRPVAPEALAQYRETVADLLVKSLRGVRAFPLADGVEPLESWRPDD